MVFVSDFYEISNIMKNIGTTFECIIHFLGIVDWKEIAVGNKEAKIIHFLDISGRSNRNLILFFQFTFR